MEKGALLTLSLPCNTNKKLPMLLERVERGAIDNGNGGVLHNGMSLFQDLKLKRRKVDSRCSSDGESIGTSESASSLSPDQPQGGEGSPKAEEKRCLTPEELVAPGPATDSNGFPSKFFYMNVMKNDGSGVRKSPSTNNNNYDSLKGSNGLSKVNNGTTVTTTANVLVVKSEPGEDSSRSTPSSSPSLEDQQLHRKNPLKRREMSPPKENGHSHNGMSMMTNGHHISNGQNGHKSDSESITSIKSEKRDDSSCEEKGDEKMDTLEENNSSPGLPMSLASSPRSILSSASSTGSHRSSPPRALSHPSSSPRRSPPQGQRESPSTLIITKGQPNNSSSQRSSPAMSQSSRGGSPPGPPMMGTHFLPPHHQLHPSNGLSHHQMHHPSHGPVPGLFHATQLHARLTGGMGGDPSRREQQQQRETSNGSPMVHVEIRNLSSNSSDKNTSNNNNTSEPPLSVVTSTSLSFHQSSMYRINGVRPEVISGGAVTPSGGTGSTGGGQGLPSSHNSPSGLHNLSSHSLQMQQQNGGGGHGGSSMNNGHHNHNGSVGGMHHHNVSHLPFQTRKSPTHLMSRSPNSSPSNSSSSGSIQHSPGSTGSSGGCSTVGGTIIAGGNIGMVNTSNAGTNGTHHVNLSRTPTVIMGEAGGVRTMLWSQPGQNIPNPALEIGLGGGSSPPGSGGNSSISSGASSNGSYAGSLHNGSGGGSSPPGNQSNSNGSSNVGTHGSNSSNGHHHPAIQKGVLSMERLWASEALNLSTGASNTTNGHGGIGGANGGGHNMNGQTGGGAAQNQDDDDYEQPMICMICEDRATGLHYGIITCEGCKGFFKRTVQNRRVYTCVADGTCEITKAQRNRCQYCRFKKCIEQGMVLQAVREDRMPGGRNSGAVYNLYKVPVKYRKHKKGNRGAAQNGKGDKQNNTNSTNNNNNPTTNLSSLTLSNNNTNNSSGQTQSSSSNNGNSTSMLPPHPGNILMAALTRDPKEAIPLRREHVVPFDQAANMINALVQCDNFHDIAALHNWEELLEARGDLSDKLCQMGDSIVYRLVQWTKRLPFYSEVPVEVHTRVLTHKWHELLVLTTSAWHAMHSPAPPPGMSAEEEALDNLKVLQSCLQAMMGRSLTLEQLKQDVGLMVERLTYLTRTFRRLGIRLEEYVTLKVIAMLQNTGTKSDSVNQIQERYIKVLRTFLEMTVPSQPNRLTELLRCLPEVQAAATLLLESKMFYVPFLLNSALLQR